MTIVASTEQQYRFVGSHADMLANGRPVEPGEFVDLSEEDLAEVHNEMLVADGNLVFIGDSQNPEATDAAVKLAKQNKIPLTAITGTGAADGQITATDVESYVRSNPPSGEES